MAESIVGPRGSGGGKAARIVDVAESAGVSTATVSRVLNNLKVHPDTANNVWTAVRELGYAPDRTARSLRRGLSSVITLIVPDVSNPFFTLVARGVEDVARGAGYSVVLCNSDDLVGRESEYLKVAQEENVAGVIIAPASREPALAPLVEHGRGIVVIDRAIDQAVDQLTFDNAELGRHTTKRLIQHGRKRIACVTGHIDIPTAGERAAGWQAALLEAGLDEGPLIHTDFRVGGGRHAMDRLLKSGDHFDAVVATNNMIGAGVLQALSEANALEGIDVGVVGELPASVSGLRNNVSVTALHPKRLGQRAAQMLFERINGPGKPPRRETQTNLVA